MSKVPKDEIEFMSLDDKIEWAEWKVKMEQDNLDELRREKSAAFRQVSLAQAELSGVEMEQFRLGAAESQARRELDDALARLDKLTEEEALFSSRQRHQQRVLDEVFHTSGVTSTPDSGPELQGYDDKHG